MSLSKIKRIKVSQKKSTNRPKTITIISLYVVPELALNPKVASYISCGLCFLIELRNINRSNLVTIFPVVFRLNHRIGYNFEY